MNLLLSLTFVYDSNELVYVFLLKPSRSKMSQPAFKSVSFVKNNTDINDFCLIFGLHIGGILRILCASSVVTVGKSLIIKSLSIAFL